jgi:nucleoside-diphosphate-sugar epimerase
MRARPGHALVTGVGGFVGGAVARSLLQAGWQVTGAYRKCRPAELEGMGSLNLVAADLRNCESLPGRYDYVVHCAAEVPARCPDEDELFCSNVEGTRCLLAHAAISGAQNVTYMSSMAVYGAVSAAVVDERTSLNTAGRYASSKAEGERQLAEWADRTGGAGVSIRLPGVVGTGGRNNFLCDTLQRILADQPLTAFNPDALFNNIVHVDDLAGFVVGLAARMPKGHTALTIAAREPLAVRDVLARLYRRARRGEQITWGRRGEPFVIGFERACALGYTPPTVAGALDHFVADVLADPAFAS